MTRWNLERWLDLTCLLWAALIVRALWHMLSE